MFNHLFRKKITSEEIVRRKNNEIMNQIKHRMIDTIEEKKRLETILMHTDDYEKQDAVMNQIKMLTSLQNNIIIQAKTFSKLYEL